jgi:hypothetical protein
LFSSPITIKVIDQEAQDGQDMQHAFGKWEFEGRDQLRDSGGMEILK